MARFAVHCIPLLLLGCATAPTAHPAIEPALPPSPAPAVTPDPAPPRTTGPATPAVGFTLSPEELPNAASITAAPQEEDTHHRSRFTLKGGYYSTQDTNALDDGYIIDLSWMQFMSKIFAMEFETGYIDASGKDAGINTDMWGIPTMLNGRLNFPVWKLDLYGGLGLGSIYYDLSSSGGGISKSGWVFAGDAFLGTSFNLGEAISLGLEGKYFLTDNVGGLDGGLDAFALMLTLGFSR